MKIRGLLLLILLTFNKKVITIVLKEKLKVKELKVIKLKGRMLIIRINV